MPFTIHFNGNPAKWQEKGIKMSVETAQTIPGAIPYTQYVVAFALKYG